MKTPFRSDQAFRELREKAEKLLKGKAGEALDMEKEDLAYLIHELEINQVELEMQNEELRRLKGELEGARNEFADLYESAPVAYVTLDQKRMIEKANKASYRIFRNSEPILGSPFLVWVHADDLPVYNSFMKEVALNREAGPVELRLRNLEGPLDVRIEATAGVDPEQGVREYRLTFVDVTEQKRAGEELRKAKEELEMRVKERTEELAKSRERLQNLASQLLLAQEKERKRVAIELHDGLLSELAATKYLLEGKVMLLEKGKLIDPGELKRVIDILASTMREARKIMTNLHPSVLDELGLIAAINWLCKEYQTSYPHIRVQRQIGV
jgi:signal transduction histidine kinase